MVLLPWVVKLTGIRLIWEAMQINLPDETLYTPFPPLLRSHKKVIHKLSTLLTKIGLKDSFPIGLRSVTMKWGKVGDFGEIIVW